MLPRNANRQRSLSLYTAVFLAHAFVAACGSDNPLPPVIIEPGPTDRPDVGSIYVFAKHEFDSVGLPTSAPPTMFFTRVEKDNQTFRGRSNVMLLVEDGDELYVDYEFDNDVAIIPNVHDTIPNVGWEVLPFGSRATIASRVDSSVSGGSGTLADTTTFIGVESVTTKAGTFDTQRVRKVLTYTLSIGPLVVREYRTTDIWYAPAIGYFVKREITHDGANRPPVLFRREVLESYVR